jgi:hypothetical protein
VAVGPQHFVPFDGRRSDSALFIFYEDELVELPKRLQRVLRLRTGLIDRRTWTLQDVAGQLGLTKERVRQLQNEALRLCRIRGGRQGLPVGVVLEAARPLSRYESGYAPH